MEGWKWWSLLWILRGELDKLPDGTLKLHHESISRRWSLWPSPSTWVPNQSSPARRLPLFVVCLVPCNGPPFNPHLTFKQAPRSTLDLWAVVWWRLPRITQTLAWPMHLSVYPSFASSLPSMPLLVVGLMVPFKVDMWWCLRQRWYFGNRWSTIPYLGLALVQATESCSLFLGSRITSCCMCCRCYWVCLPVLWAFEMPWFEAGRTSSSRQHPQARLGDWCQSILWQLSQRELGFFGDGSPSEPGDASGEGADAICLRQSSLGFFWKTTGRWPHQRFSKTTACRSTSAWPNQISLGSWLCCSKKEAATRKTSQPGRRFQEEEEEERKEQPWDCWGSGPGIWRCCKALWSDWLEGHFCGWAGSWRWRSPWEWLFRCLHRLHYTTEPVIYVNAATPRRDEQRWMFEYVWKNFLKIVDKMRRLFFTVSSLACSRSARVQIFWELFGASQMGTIGNSPCEPDVRWFLPGPSGFDADCLCVALSPRQHSAEQNAQWQWEKGKCVCVGDFPHWAGVWWWVDQLRHENRGAYAMVPRDLGDALNV